MPFGTICSTVDVCGGTECLLSSQVWVGKIVPLLFFVGVNIWTEGWTVVKSTAACSTQFDFGCSWFPEGKDRIGCVHCTVQRSISDSDIGGMMQPDCYKLPGQF